MLTSLKDRASVMAHAMARDLRQVGDKDDIDKRLQHFLSLVAAEGERLRLTHADNPAGILNTASVGQVLLAAGSEQLLTVGRAGVCAGVCDYAGGRGSARCSLRPQRGRIAGRGGAHPHKHHQLRSDRLADRGPATPAPEPARAARRKPPRTPQRLRHASRAMTAATVAALGARDLRPATQQPARLSSPRRAPGSKSAMRSLTTNPALRNSCSFAPCNRKLSRADEQELKKMFRR